MSARNFSNIKSRQSGDYVPRTLCCKVCKDAGESEEVYSSHYVKDRDGNVCCPKLKAIVCPNCGKRGHTRTYCKAPTEKQREEYAAKAVEKKVADKPVATGASRFACLVDSDSDDDNKLLQRKNTRPAQPAAVKMPAIQPAKNTDSKAVLQVSNTNDFPSLSTDSKTTTKPEPPKALSYANMAAKPVEVKVVRPTFAVPVKIIRPPSPTTVPDRELTFESIKGKYGFASNMDWAQSDSDSDEE
jgi:hypothetical protein